jgi:hypothetical protein
MPGNITYSNVKNATFLGSFSGQSGDGDSGGGTCGGAGKRQPANTAADFRRSPPLRPLAWLKRPPWTRSGMKIGT